MSLSFSGADLPSAGGGSTDLLSLCRGVSAFDSLNTKQWQTVLMAMEKRLCLAGEVVVAQVGACTVADMQS